MNSRKPRQFDWQAIKHRLAPRDVGPDCDAADSQTRLQKVYRSRMVDYASRKRTRPDRSSRRQVVVCSIGARDFGIDIAKVVKVIPLSQCVGIPGVPGGVIGVVNVAGEIYSVVDAAALVGTSASSDNKPAVDGHAMLLRGTESNVALKVDSVKAIENVDIAKLSSPDRVRAEKDPEIAAAGCAAGVTSEDLIVLDMEQLLSHPIFSPETVCK
jgi:chemotaxis signal transduction protein